MPKNQNDKPELILVFKKDIDPKKATEILGATGVAYRTGMDSSRGKLYFYSTGPKFILTFTSHADKDNFESRYESHGDIHEIYTPDWTKCKD